MAMPRLFLVLYLIGWEDGASFLDQSESQVNQNQNNPGLLSTLNWKLLFSSFQGCGVYIFWDGDGKAFFPRIYRGGSASFNFQGESNFVNHVCRQTHDSKVIRSVPCIRAQNGNFG